MISERRRNTLIITAVMISALGVYYVLAFWAAVSASADGLGSDAGDSATLPYLARWVDEDCALVCYAWLDGSGGCFPCGKEACDVNVESTPTDEKDKTATPGVPTSVPTGTATVVPEPSTTPEPKCNRGVGNGSEGCDPGNSGGKGRGDGRPAGEDRRE